MRLGAAADDGAVLPAAVVEGESAIPTRTPPRRLTATQRLTKAACDIASKVCGSACDRGGRAACPCDHDARPAKLEMRPRPPGVCVGANRVR